MVGRHSQSTSVRPRWFLPVVCICAFCSPAAATRATAPSARGGVRGRVSQDSGVTRHNNVFAARLPAQLDFSSAAPAPLLHVLVDDASLKPEEGRDMKLVLGLDSNQRLRLHSHTGLGSSHEGVVELAWANYSNTVNESGWAHLSVEATSDPQVSDDLKVYAAGWVEGFATARQIRDFQHNAGALVEKDEKDNQALDNIRDLFEKEIHAICSKAGVVASGTAPPSPSRGAPQVELWWRHARLMLMQAWGLLDAYNLHVDSVRGKPMSMVDLFVLNSDGETPELEKAYDFQEMALRQSIRECGEGGDCDGDADSGSSDASNASGGAPSFVQTLSYRADVHFAPDVGTQAYHIQEVALRQSQAVECEEGSDCDEQTSDENASDSGMEDRSPDSDAGSVFLQSRSGGAKRTGEHSRHPSRKGMRARVKAQREKTEKSWDDRSWRVFRRSYGRCSALVRLAPNNSDIFVGHTTFSDYSEMNRIFKYYSLPLEGGASRRMGFSSYPGVLGSTDDYYIMDTGLVVTETTVSMLSDEAFDKLDDNGTRVPDYMRIMLTNRLARTGQEWVELMTKSATGTYNSQWMIVDYKAFEPRRELRNGTLWVLEQAPGVSHSQDMTAQLRRSGYWASENRAFFGDVRAVSGEAEAEGLRGRLFSASRNPRANIFAKTAPQVVSLADMRAEMQRNKWPHDVDGGPENTPDHAIAARGDLVSQDPVPNGGVDAKVTSACLVKPLVADAICGPAHDGLPPFSWKDSQGHALYPEYPRDGLPDVWNFGWVRMTPGGELSGRGRHGPPEADCYVAP